MRSLSLYVHSYLLCLLRPGLVHDWFKHGISPWSDVPDLPRPSLAEFIGMSWAMAVVQGFSKLLLANLIIHSFLALQNDGGLFLQMVDSGSGLLPYYLLLFSTSLDLIFFPIMALVTLEFWKWILRAFGLFMGLSEEQRKASAEEVTLVALSSNFFLGVPVLGPFLQKLAWLFLMYVGLRRNLGASRGLSFVILLTPLFMLAAILALLALGIFYLMSI